MATNENAAGAPKRKRSAWKWIVSIIVVILIIIILAVIFAPYYISSNSGREMILGKINSSLKDTGHVNIADLSMGWFSGIKLSGINYTDNKGATTVNVKSIYAEPHYRSIIGGNIVLGKTVIDEPVIHVDLAKFQQPAPSQPAKEEQPQPAAPKSEQEKRELPVKQIDLVINNGNISVSDSSKGNQQLGTLAKINTAFSLRPAGEQTTFNINLIAADAPIGAQGQITPSEQKGWQLSGMTGNMKFDVNNLDFQKLGGIFALIDPNIIARGTINASGVAKLNNGVFEQMQANLDGRNLAFKLPQLKGDTFMTSKLTGVIDVAAQDQLTKIKQMNLQTDFAQISLTGTMPTTMKSIQDLLSPGSPAQLQGKVAVDIAAIVKQLPHTLGLKPGTELNSGRLDVTLNTETAGNEKVLAAKATIANVKGMVNGKAASLSAPIDVNARIAGAGQTIRIEQGTLSSSFVTANVSGTPDSLKYGLKGDLSKMEAELGQFVSFDPYKFAGQISVDGRYSQKEKTIATDGSANFTNLNIAKQGASVTEPNAVLTYDLAIDQAKNILSIKTFNFNSSFAQAQVSNGTIPMAAGAPMNANAKLALDIGKAMPWAVALGGLSNQTRITGQVNADVNMAGKGNDYEIKTTDTRITNLVISAPNQQPMSEKQITLAADAIINPVAKTIQVNNLKLNSTIINIEGSFSQTSAGSNTSLKGDFKASYDLAALSAMASPFVPGLTMSGKRNDTFSVSSTWPQSKPDQMLANMNAKGSFGFDKASYKGLDVGSTNIAVNMQNGQLSIPPFQSAVNSGTLNFGGSADFRKKPVMFQTPGQMDVLKGVQVTDAMAKGLLKNVPMIGDSSGASGTINVSSSKMAVPISGGDMNQMDLAATMSIVNLTMKSSGILSQIKSLIPGMGGNTVLNLKPSTVTVSNGIVKYDKMLFDLNGTPITIAGDMTVDGTIRTMTLTLQTHGINAAIPLTGNISHPSLDKSKLLGTVGQGLLDGVLGGQQQNQQQSTTPTTPQNKHQQEQQQIQQGLQNIFKGLGGNK
jgi:hypothetical protein